MKQTAVEWFYDKIKSHFEHDGDLLETLIFTKAIAKKKEKEQIMDAWCNGFEESRPYVDHSEDYYNETFNKEL